MLAEDREIDVLFKGSTDKPQFAQYVYPIFLTLGARKPPVHVDFCEEGL